MDYRYLKKWVSENLQSSNNLTVLEVRRQQNSLAISFKGKSEFLQIALESNNPFLFFTEQKILPFRKDTRVEVLNQHLTHSRLLDLAISDLDRLITLDLQKTDIYNQKVEYRLTLELIPHQANLVLSRKGSESYVIIDCWRYVTLAAKSSRQILPGAAYEPPLKPERENYAAERFYLSEVEYPLRITDLVNKRTDLADSVKKREFNDINTLFEALFYEVLLPQKQQKRFSDLIKQIQKKKEKKEQKLAKLRKEYADSERSEDYKKRAELLKVNLHSIRKGMDEIKVVDYYSEEQQELVIPLHKELTPQQNMHLLFKKYRKGSSGKELIQKQIDKTGEEIEQLEREMFDLENNLQDPELSVDIPGDDGKGARKLQRSDKYRRLRIDQDWEIFIGRTNRENDELTCKMARPDDWWFHTRIFHGAHIILRNYHKLELPLHLLELCCRLAAYFSKAKNSENVPVDYTQIRYVSKPHGSPAGYVIYKNQKTLYVNPLSLREAARMVESWGK